MEWSFLMNCADDFEATFVMGALKEEGISTFKRYRSGDHMKIIEGLGKDVDIFVPEEQLNRARQILEALRESQ